MRPLHRVVPSSHNTQDKSNTNQTSHFRAKPRESHKNAMCSTSTSAGGRVPRWAVSQYENPLPVSRILVAKLPAVRSQCQWHLQLTTMSLDFRPHLGFEIPSGLKIHTVPGRVSQPYDLLSAYPYPVSRHFSGRFLHMDASQQAMRNLPFPVAHSHAARQQGAVLSVRWRGRDMCGGTVAAGAEAIGWTDWAEWARGRLWSHCESRCPLGGHHL